MKKLLLSIFVIMFCAFIVVHNHNSVKVQLELGASDIFSQEEIESAMNVVKEAFADRFGRHSRLISLSYQEGSFKYFSNAFGFDKSNNILIMSTYDQRRYGRLGHGWKLSREGSSEPWVLISGPFPGNMGH